MNTMATKRCKIFLYKRVNLIIAVSGSFLDTRLARVTYNKIRVCLLLWNTLTYVRVQLNLNLVLVKPTTLDMSEPSAGRLIIVVDLFFIWCSILCNQIFMLLCPLRQPVPIIQHCTRHIMGRLFRRFCSITISYMQHCRSIYCTGTQRLQQNAKNCSITEKSDSDPIKIVICYNFCCSNSTLDQKLLTLLPCLIEKCHKIFNLNHFILNTSFDVWCYAVESWMRVMQCDFCLQHDEKCDHQEGCCSSKKAWQHGRFDLGHPHRKCSSRAAEYYILQLHNDNIALQLHDTRTVVNVNTIRIAYVVCKSL